MNLQGIGKKATLQPYQHLSYNESTGYRKKSYTTSHTSTGVIMNLQGIGNKATLQPYQHWSFREAAVEPASHTGSC